MAREEKLSLNSGSQKEGKDNNPERFGTGEDTLPPRMD